MSNTTAQAATCTTSNHHSPQIATENASLFELVATTATTTICHTARPLDATSEKSQRRTKQMLAFSPQHTLSIPPEPPEPPSTPPGLLNALDKIRASAESSYRSSNKLKKENAWLAAATSEDDDHNLSPGMTKSPPQHICTTTATTAVTATGCTIQQVKQGGILSEQERIEERNRKGRERSMRTRHRNASRLRLLQENCAYLYGENGLLREIVDCCHTGETVNTVVIRGLLGRLLQLRKERPRPYIARGKEGNGKGKGKKEEGEENFGAR